MTGLGGIVFRKTLDFAFVPFASLPRKESKGTVSRGREFPVTLKSKERGIKIPVHNATVYVYM